MIGQKRLLDRIDKYSLNNFPNTSLILGEDGSGKHLIAKYIADRFNVELVDITKIIDNEVIDNIYRSSSINFYLIDLDELTEKFADKNQNMILKFIEEPLSNAFILLLAENKYALLDTIVNRCIIFDLDKYSDEELLNFTSNKDIIKLVRTPGKIALCQDTISDMNTLCNKIVNDLGKANFANALTIADKFNYSDEYDKFDVDIFLTLLINTFFNNYKDNNNVKSLKMYLLLADEVKKLKDKRLSKKIFMQHLIIKLWKEAVND